MWQVRIIAQSSPIVACKIFPKILYQLHLDAHKLPFKIDFPGLKARPLPMIGQRMVVEGGNQNAIKKLLENHQEEARMEDVIVDQNFWVRVNRLHAEDELPQAQQRRLKQRLSSRQKQGKPVDIVLKQIESMSAVPGSINHLPFLNMASHSHNFRLFMERETSSEKPEDPGTPSSYGLGSWMCASSNQS